MCVVSVVFYLLTFLDFIRAHNKFIVLILLAGFFLDPVKVSLQYIQLSANRIRYYLYDLFLNDYCMKKEIWVGQDLYLGGQCFIVFRDLDESRGADPYLLREYAWEITEKVHRLN